MSCFICNQKGLALQNSREDDVDDNFKEKKLLWNDNLHRLNEKAFKKCYEAIAIRRLHTLKYGDLILNGKNKDKYIFHGKCYKMLTFLKRKYQGSVKETEVEGTEGPLHKMQPPDPQVTEDCTDFIERECVPGHSNKSKIDDKDQPEMMEEFLETLASTGAREVATTVTTTEQSNEYESLNRNNLKCVICKQQTRRVGSKRQYCSRAGDDMKSNILMYASFLNDEKLLKELNSIDNFTYHPVCLTSYRKKFDALIKEDEKPSEWHKIRLFHAVAYEILSKTIRTEVIEKEEIFTMSDIYSKYMTILKEECKGDELTFENYPTHRLQSKLLNDYGKTIVIRFSKAMHRNIIHKKDINANKLVGW